MSKLVCLTAIVLLTAFSATWACDPRDDATLLAIKNSFLPNAPASSWCYVECDDTTGRITTLSVSDNKDLKGPIPPAIGDLTALQSISFSNLPGLSGPIPSQLARLTDLQYLTIYKTKVSGPVPSFLSTFAGLKELELANNALIGTIPASLGQLVNLSTISLFGNQLSGAIPDSLFSKLAPGFRADLDLSDNTLKGPIPKTLGNVAFGNFAVGSNQLTGDASFLFGESKTLTFQIVLSKNKLAFDLSNVHYPPNLQYLDISHNQIYGSISSQITELKSFTYLDVKDNRLCGLIPSGGSFRQFGADTYSNNKCLCGTPLPACH